MLCSVRRFHKFEWLKDFTTYVYVVKILHLFSLFCHETLSNPSRNRLQFFMFLENLVASFLYIFVLHWFLRKIRLLSFAIKQSLKTISAQEFNKLNASIRMIFSFFKNFKWHLLFITFLGKIIHRIWQELKEYQILST